MEAIVSALREELRQAKALVKRYGVVLEKLPDGSFFVRSIGKQRYGYITRSHNGQVFQEYLGKLDDASIALLQAQMQRKKKIGQLLKQAKAQVDFLQKAIRHARKKS
jgi:hypothetical protein